jgi:hypothetical protein
MTGQRRGLSKERHSLLKVAFAAVAVAGFAGAWAGFANAHSPEALGGAALTPTGVAGGLPATPIPVASMAVTSTPALGQATSTLAATPEPEAPVPTRAKRSRGS